MTCKMAGVWFSIFVILMAGRVFARDCILQKIKNCDECIQCAGVWCKTERQCSDANDQFCPTGREEGQLPNVGSPDFEPIEVVNTQTGQPVPINQAVKVAVSVTNQLVVPRLWVEKVTITNLIFVNSSIPNLNQDFFTVNVLSKDFDDKKNLEYTIEGVPSTNFCPARGAKTVETVTYKLEDSRESARITYHVPCACDCSSDVKLNAAECNGRGNFSCGICKCKAGWKGDFCNVKDTQPILPDCGDRGDISGCMPSFGGPVCSDNGQCDCQGKCVCRTDIPGYQYFNEHCTDICTLASFCDSCLTKYIKENKEGTCYDCPSTLLDMHMDHYNKSRMNDIDSAGRKVWINCVEKTESCDIHYAAMKDGRGTTHIMVVDACKVVEAASQVGGPVNVVVPVVLGVIALVAAASAVAGYMVWKSRGPPLPFAEHDYGNIEAEDCTGENPLYKPPTSSFKNPTYGKW